VSLDDVPDGPDVVDEPLHRFHEAPDVAFLPTPSKMTLHWRLAFGPPRPHASGVTTPSTLPVVYIPHGGGPWAFVDIGFSKTESDALKAYLRSVRELPQSPPKALLVVSAHWEEALPTVMTSPSPPILYDYYGFPPEAYRIPWPAPGDPELAARVRSLLGTAGIESAEDPDRGFDHGTFIPLKVMYPDAEVPTIQLSLKAGLDAAEHLAIGRALAPLRDEGVFIIGSGMSFHNMGAFRSHTHLPAGEAFDRWLAETAAAEPAERERRLERWAAAPGARAAHPREEHLLPLMVVAGAAGKDRGRVPFNGSVLGYTASAVQFG
jgi:aromatic ring-opening dioxygenase catalytic subunit (LigB family)